MNKIRKKKNKIQHKTEKGKSDLRIKKRYDVNKLSRLIEELEKVMKEN